MSMSPAPRGQNAKKIALRYLFFTLGLLINSFGIGTVISALGLGSLINLNFSLLHFHPAKVHQENIAETLRYLRS